jgi:hypothetical protein
MKPEERHFFCTPINVYSSSIQNKKIYGKTYVRAENCFIKKERCWKSYNILSMTHSMCKQSEPSLKNEQRFKWSQEYYLTNPSHDKIMASVTSEWQWRNYRMNVTGENWSTRRKAFPVTLCIRKSSYELTWDWNQSSVVIGRRLTS